MPVAIVYGEASGIVRRFIRAETEKGETVANLAGHYGEGESIIIVDDDEIMAMTKNGLKPDLDFAVARVAEKRGKPAEEARCVVIDDESGDIEKAIMADPVLDALPGKTLYQSADADVAWTLDAEGEFTAPAVLEAEEFAAEVKP